MNQEVQLNLVYGDTIHYAMTVNKVPFIRKCVLSNLTEKSIPEVSVMFFFQENLAEEFTVSLGTLPPLGEVDLGMLHIILRKEVLFNLTEAAHLSMGVHIRTGELVIAEMTYPVLALSYNQWQGYEIMPELLAAFVTPNHPSIDKVLLEASEILKISGKDPSFEGYQRRDPNRVMEQVHAIYSAVMNRNIRYVGPPASFAENGQRIRLSSEVLENSLGTCLDLTLLLAACLEAVSLYPIILLMEGHAYLGFWLEEEFFTDPVLYDVASLRKRTAEGMNYISVLEATDLRDGLKLPFTDAIAHGSSHLSVEKGFLLAVDVKRARAGGVLPLPERIVRDGKFSLSEETTREQRAQELPELKAVLRVQPEAKEDTLDRKSQWERKLLDLSLRNQLLSYTENRKGLRLLAPDVKDLEDLLYEGKEFQILPRMKDLDTLDGGDSLSPLEIQSVFRTLLEGEYLQGKLRTLLPEIDLEKKLTKIFREAKTQMEESGANHLFLTVGMLKWFESDVSERARFAPVLLVPVELKKKFGKFSYILSAREEDVLMNVTLLEKLKMDFGLEIRGLEELPQDEKGVHVLEVFSALRNAILSKKRWDILEETHLGLFSFSKFIMWHDLRTQGEAMEKNEVIASLLEGKRTFPLEEIDDEEEVDPSEVLLPVSTDASQLKAVKEALKGRSFVLHGPPGTGKSQTITTIIANALYQGKKVLFVAEKMAALSVVQKRLEALGLGDFSLEVHSNKSKKSTILKKLDDTTKRLRNGSVPFQDEADRLKNQRMKLAAYVDSLYKPHTLGLSAYSLIGKLESLNESLSFTDLKITASELENTSEEKLLRLTRDFASAVHEIGAFADAPLKGITLTQYNYLLKDSVELPLQSLRAASDSLEVTLEEFAKTHGVPDLDTLHKLNAFYEYQSFRASLKMNCGFLLEDALSQVIPELKRLYNELGRLSSDLTKGYGAQLFQLPVKELEANYKSALTQGPIRGFLAKKKVMKVISGVSRSGKVHESDMLPLFEQVEERAKLNETIGEYLKNHPSLSALTIEESPLSVLETMDRVRALYEEKTRPFSKEDQVILGRLLTLPWDNEDESLQKAFLHFQACFEEVDGLLQLSVGELPDMEGTYLERLQDRLLTYLNNLDELREWTHYNEVARKVEAEGLSCLVHAYKKNIMSPEAYEDSMKKSIYRILLQDILEKEPLLMQVTGKTYEDQINYFKEISDSYEKLCGQEIVHVLSARVPDLVKEASSSSEVGILQRAIRSGGRGVTLRSLFEKLPNLLPRITPCMLMSPLSVAQYLGPAKAYFDLVIFDEASQMPTAEAVGAMARGQHVVIVGDPKQLPPTTFFQVEKITEEEDGTEADLDNILEDALALSLPETYLLWHYRSRHESLIAFSNRTYYDNKLYTYPSPQERVSKVTFEYVEATYGRGGNRANRLEAEKVIQEIKQRYLVEGKTESIGVVTFSTAQKDMIEDLLGETFKENPAFEEKILTMEEPFFVKNLENVQGDERDVVLFSVGYGPDENGKITMNFGPLNRENGWKRLNVAITRAKKEMKIFTSILPEQMDTTKTSSKGVQDLKEFLEYARRGRSIQNLDTIKREKEESEFLYSVKKALEDKGLTVDALVGTSKYRLDLGIVDEKENTYKLGLQCFGTSYQEAQTVRDRDILQESVLKGLGWHIMKINPVDWLENKHNEVARILGTLQDPEEWEAENTTVIPASAAFRGAVESTEHVQKQTQEGPERIYEEAQFSIKPLSAEEFRMPKNTRMLKEVLLKIIDIEAPISLPLLYRQVLKVFTVRYTEKSVQVIDAVLSNLGFGLMEEDGMLFVVGESGNEEFYRVPSMTFKREFRDIPKSELTSAVISILKNQISLPEEALVTELLKVFGFKKAPEGCQEKIEAVLEVVAKNPVVVLEDGVYSYRI